MKEVMPVNFQEYFRNKPPWLLSKDEVAKNPNMQILKNMGDAVARYETDGTLTFSKSYFDHSINDRKKVFVHEVIHGIIDENEQRFWDLVDSGKVGYFDDSSMEWNGVWTGRNPAETIVNIAQMYVVGSIGKVQSGKRDDVVEAIDAILNTYPEIEDLNSVVQRY